MARIRVLLAPSGFKEALGVEEVGAAIARGLRRASAEVEATAFRSSTAGRGSLAASSRYFAAACTRRGSRVRWASP
jgi:glycerate kinase